MALIWLPTPIVCRVAYSSISQPARVAGLVIAGVGSGLFIGDTSTPATAENGGLHLSYVAPVQNTQQVVNELVTSTEKASSTESPTDSNTPPALPPTGQTDSTQPPSGLIGTTGGTEGTFGSDSGGGAPSGGSGSSSGEGFSSTDTRLTERQLRQTVRTRSRTTKKTKTKTKTKTRIRTRRTKPRKKRKMKSQPRKKSPSARPDPVNAFLFAGALLAAAAWTPLVHAGVAGQITHLSGTLSAKRADGSSKLLSVKSEILEGDTLSTETETYARASGSPMVAKSFCAPAPRSRWKAMPTTPTSRKATMF